MATKSFLVQWIKRSIIGNLTTLRAKLPRNRNGLCTYFGTLFQFELEHLAPTCGRCAWERESKEEAPLVGDLIGNMTCSWLWDLAGSPLGRAKICLIAWKKLFPSQLLLVLLSFIHSFIHHVERAWFPLTKDRIKMHQLTAMSPSSLWTFVPKLPKAYLTKLFQKAFYLETDLDNAIIVVLGGTTGSSSKIIAVYLLAICPFLCSRIPHCL